MHFTLAEVSALCVGDGDMQYGIIDKDRVPVGRYSDTILLMSHIIRIFALHFDHARTPVELQIIIASPLFYFYCLLLAVAPSLGRNTEFPSAEIGPCRTRDTGTKWGR